MQPPVALGSGHWSFGPRSIPGHSYLAHLRSNISCSSCVQALWLCAVVAAVPVLLTRWRAQQTAHLELLCAAVAIAAYCSLLFQVGGCRPSGVQHQGCMLLRAGGMARRPGGREAAALSLLGTSRWRRDHMLCHCRPSRPPTPHAGQGAAGV